jgi:hypothetical protein
VTNDEVERREAEAIDRARKTREIFENEVFVSAVAETRAAILSAWASTKLTDTDERERLWMLEQSLQKVLRALRNTMETGKVVQADIQARKTLFQRLR